MLVCGSVGSRKNQQCGVEYSQQALDSPGCASVGDRQGGVGRLGAPVQGAQEGGSHILISRYSSSCRREAAVVTAQYHKGVRGQSKVSMTPGTVPSHGSWSAGESTAAYGSLCR